MARSSIDAWLAEMQVRLEKLSNRSWMMQMEQVSLAIGGICMATEGRRRIASDSHRFAVHLIRFL